MRLTPTTVRVIRDGVERVVPAREVGLGDVLRVLPGEAMAAAAGHMAAQAGIDDLRANCLPEDKLAAIVRYREHGDAVCMVGDGINDAPP